jgi:L-amino acid N-acyltransferase
MFNSEFIHNVLYRPATLDDLGQIRLIWAYYIENTTASWRYQPLDDDAMVRWIKAHRVDNRSLLVAEIAGQVVGYGCLSDFRSGEGYWPCAENSVYVLPEFQNQGIGSELMSLILQCGKKAGLKAIIAGIDASNIRSVDFHKKFGFYRCGELKNIGFKNNQWLTLIFMQCDLV